MRFPVKITSSCHTRMLIEIFYIGMPVVRTDGRSVGQTLTFLPRSKRTNAHSLNVAIVQILNQRSRYCGKPSNFPHLLNFKPFYRFIKSFSMFVPFFHFPHGNHQCTILLANFHMKNHIRTWWRSRLISQLRVWSEGTQVSRFKSWVRQGTPKQIMVVFTLEPK